MDNKAQVSFEYLVMVGVGLVVAAIAVLLVYVQYKITRKER